MKNRIIALSRLFAIGGAFGGVGLLAAASPEVTPDRIVVDDQTEDVIYMNDGRVFRGRVLDEARTYIRFEMVDATLGSKTQITIFRDDILKLERDVKIEAPVASSTKTTEAGTATTGAAEVDPSVPSIYIVPFKGQMGTDVRPELYDAIIDDIKAKKPSCIVFKLDCNAWDYLDPRSLPEGIDLDSVVPGEYYDFEDYRSIVARFRTELRDTKQVMWVKDSIGVSSVLAMAWPTMFVSEDGDLGGFVFVAAATGGWQDSDIRTKMQAAWSGIIRGFFELGERDLNLAHAMMFPDAKLSCVFRGRNVEWRLDESGEYVIDQDATYTPTFDAESARNLRIAEEMVVGSEDDQLNDLAFLLGYREWRKTDGIAESTVEEYITDWRKMMKQTVDLVAEYVQNRALAQGADTVKYLGRARANLEKILGAMKRYTAIEKEWSRFGLTPVRIELMIEEIRTIITTINAQERGRRGTGGGAPGGGNGPNPGGGGG